MKVALVQCPLWSVMQPPPGLAYVAASLRSNGYEVELHDLEAELFNRVDPSYRSRFAPDAGFETIYGELGMDAILDEWAQRIAQSGARVAGLSMFYSTEEISLDLAARIRKVDPEIKIILGGPSCDRHVHAFRFIQENQVDAVVTGEGELSILELLENFDEDTGRFGETSGALVKSDGGEVLDGGDRPVNRDLDGIAFPSYTDFDLNQYARPGSLPLLTSRGCPNRCKFCSDRSFWRKYRTRSAENVFEEIKRHHDEMGVKNFYWVDSLINGDMRRLNRLLDLILEAELKIKWYGFAMIRKEMDAAFLKKMSQAGCVLLQYGIESGSPKVRSDMGKSSDISLVERVVRDTHRAGVRVQGLFIVGYPTETWPDFLRTCQFIWRNRKFIDHLVRPTCPYVCLPNSILFDEKEEWGIKLVDDNYAEWTSQDGKNTYPTRKKRLKFFHWFVRRMGIPPEIGMDLFTEVSTRELKPMENGGIVPEGQRRARIVSIDGPARIDSQEKSVYKVCVAGCCDVTLHEWSRLGSHPVGLGYHWVNGDGEAVVFDDGSRAYLESPLEPGADTVLEMEVSAPPKAGKYVLQFALVQDGVAWFNSETPKTDKTTVTVS